MTELNLSFDGFVEKCHEKSTEINNLKYFGMSLVHHHPFTLKVEKTDMEENKNNPEHREHPFTLKVEKPDKEENKNNLEHREKRRQKGA